MLTRFVVDYLWEVKVFSAVHSVCFTMLVLCYVALYKKSLTTFEPCRADKLVMLFYLFVLASLFNSVSVMALSDFLKFTSYVSFYYLGRNTRFACDQLKAVGWFSLAALFLLSALALAGGGYQTWGNVTTFSGGYFFKTDLAVAALVFLVAALVTLRTVPLHLFAILCAGFLVFKSNARIALPLVLLLPVLVHMIRRGKAIGINWKLVVKGMALLVVGMSLFTLVDFSTLGMLGFDFSDPFSAANTQGRTVIWLALILQFLQAGVRGKLLGMGLDADAVATMRFSESLQVEGFRAHNSYLYLLICLGILGSLVFYSLLGAIFSKVPYLLRRGDRDTRSLVAFSASLLLLFLWLSMTTEIIIRPQLMVPFFLFAGLQVRQYLSIRQQDAEAYTCA